MPTPVKVALIFQSNAGYGWQEVHWYNSGSSPPVPLDTILNIVQTQLVPARIALLGSDCQCIGARASYPNNGVIASKAAIWYYTGTSGSESASQNDSLATSMYDVSNTLKKIIHIRGMPDVVVLGEAYHPELLAGYANAMTAYQTSLINNGFGWMSKSPTLSVYGLVTNYTFTPPPTGTDQVTFTCVINGRSAAFNTLNANQVYSCRISKLNRSKSNLNRTWTVTASPSGGTLTTTSPIGTGPFLAPGRFSISIPVFVQYRIAGPVRLGERRMGRPLSHYPGRRSARPVI